MFYLSNILGMRVLDRKQTVVGSIADLEVASTEKFPIVVAVLVRTRSGLSRVGWHNVRALGMTECTLKLVGSELEPNFTLQDTSMLLLNHVLDKQIVDVHGAKVVRVNDIELAESHGQLRVIAADAGLRSFLRRLGSRGRFRLSSSRDTTRSPRTRFHGASSNRLDRTCAMSRCGPPGTNCRNCIRQILRTSWMTWTSMNGTHCSRH